MCNHAYCHSPQRDEKWGKRPDNTPSKEWSRDSPEKIRCEFHGQFSLNYDEISGDHNRDTDQNGNIQQVDSTI
jgi:hypothetical protein